MNQTIVKTIAPKEHLRVAINLENCVLAQKNSEIGAIGGVSVRLAETFADELGLALEFIEFLAAGKVVVPDYLEWHLNLSAVRYTHWQVSTWNQFRKLTLFLYISSDQCQMCFLSGKVKISLQPMELKLVNSYDNATICNNLLRTNLFFHQSCSGNGHKKKKGNL